MPDDTSIHEEAGAPPAAPATDSLHTRTRAETGANVAALLAAAQRKVVVFAPALDQRLFNTTAVTGALARFAAQHPRNRARIVVADAAHFLRDNGRLVALCRRFSSFVLVRQVGSAHVGLTDMFLVVDDRAYLHQLHVEKPDVIGSLDAPRAAGQLMHRFEAIWEQSESIAGVSPVGL